MIYWKEWREAVRLLPIAMVAMVFVLWIAFPDPANDYQTIESGVGLPIVTVSILLALAIGLLQTLPELRTEVRGQLFSRPLSRTRNFLAKVATAFAVHLIAFLVPYAFFSWRVMAMSPQQLAIAPIELWSGFLLWLSGFAFYPATVWMVCRRARWIGSRTLPLVAAIGIMVLGSFAVDAKTWFSFSTWGLCAAISFVVLMVITRHAYVVLGNQTPRVESHSWGGRLSSAGLTICMLAVTGLSLLMAFLLAHEYGAAGPYQLSGLRLDGAGRLYQTVEGYQWDRVKRRYDVVVKQAAEAIETPLADGYQRPEPAYTAPSLPLLEPVFFTTQQSVSRGSVFSPIDKSSVGLDDRVGFYHRDGYFLLYRLGVDSQTSGNQLVDWFDRGGFGSRENPFGRANPGQWARYTEATYTQRDLQSPTFGRTLIDSSGIYAVDVYKAKLTTLVDQRIDAAIYLPKLASEQASAVLLDGDQLSVYLVAGLHPMDTPSDSFVKRFSLSLPAEWLAVPGSARARIVDHGDDGFSLIKATGYRALTVRVDAEGAVLETKQYLLAAESADLISAAVVQGTLPPLLNLVTSAGAMLESKWNGGSYTAAATRSYIVTVVVVTLLHLVLAGWLTRVASKRRNLSQRDTRRWYLLVPLLGIAASLSVLVLHARVPAVACPSCGKRKRVDEAVCPHCDADWSKPERVGIEVFDVSHN
ncbi:hypothetical protein CA13_50370 [Planctomycetes bacterium CA13]|uniref:Uncharacterized protein n=1 Tax=Novipirellula herctigrandis TaxID=2527986 RepID=A0A5C5Z9U6_9BACT|nr:hypothetical protein CA13_50370 [Planctomycetes bacterium CA13]